MKALLATTLIAVFLIRTPRAITTPRGRASWLACGLGGAGLLIADSFVPYATVDSWLGGNNLVHLLRNLLLTSAVWFLRAAVVQVVPSFRRPALGWKYRPTTLALGLLAISVPFLLADTAGTSSTLVTDRGDQLAIYLYASIYMTFVGLICLDLVWVLRGTWQGLLGLIRVGALVAALASVDEIVYATAIWAGTGSSGFRSITFAAFNVIYVGVAIMIFCLCALAFGKAHPLQRLTTHALLGLERHYSKDLKDYSTNHSPDLPEATTHRARMYRSLIAFSDLEVQTGTPLGLYAKIVVKAAHMQLSSPRSQLAKN